MITPPDPVATKGGIVGYGAALRRGETTAGAATQAYLDRIAAFDTKLNAYQLTCADSAMETATALDALLAAGTDLGPLMGVPVAIKDIFAVTGTPTTAGSVIDVADLIGDEGTFVKMLRRAGCIILGKTRTVEFALGGHGTNTVQGTPINPWDTKEPRAAGGSSAGSGVATAAGMCAFSIGSDTGGSVRGPASYCGTFGHKTSIGLWATDGVFPLSPTLDTIGPLTRTATDAAIVYAALTGNSVPKPIPLRGLRLGRLTNVVNEELEADVANCMDAAYAKLTAAGVKLIDIDVPECGEALDIFGPLVTSELIARLGRERFLAGKDKMDFGVAARSAMGLEVRADDWVRLRRRHDQLIKIGRERMRGLDGWVTPTRQMVAPTIAECMEPESHHRLSVTIARNTRISNLFAQCATSTPINGLGAALPVGLQIICNGGDDAKLLSIACAIEDLIGEPPAPDLKGFQ